MFTKENFRKLATTVQFEGVQKVVVSTHIRLGYRGISIFEEGAYIFFSYCSTFTY